MSVPAALLAAIRLNIVCKVVLDPLCEDGKLRSMIFERIAREQLERDSTAIDRLTRPEDDNNYEFLLGISQNNARVDNLAPSICAVLAAEACNIGIEPLVDPEDPALTYARLA